MNLSLILPFEIKPSMKLQMHKDEAYLIYFNQDEGPSMNSTIQSDSWETWKVQPNNDREPADVHTGIGV